MKQSGSGHAHMYTLTKKDATASNNVVLGILLTGLTNAQVLFDSGLTHSFLSPFARSFDSPIVSLGEPLDVSTPSSYIIHVYLVLKSCVIVVNDHEMLAEQIC